MIGTRDDCIEQQERYREELGVDDVTLRFRLPTGPSLEVTCGQIQRFGEEVCSYLHDRYPAPVHPAIPEACHWYVPRQRRRKGTT